MGHEDILIETVPTAGKDWAGFSNPATREVWVTTGLTGYQTFHTLIHELLHQLCVLHPIKDEERTVSALSHGLVDLLLGNTEEWVKLLRSLDEKGNRNGIVREK